MRWEKCAERWGMHKILNVKCQGSQLLKLIINKKCRSKLPYNKNKDTDVRVEVENRNSRKQKTENTQHETRNRTRI